MLDAQPASRPIVAVLFCHDRCSTALTVHAHGSVGGHRVGPEPTWIVRIMPTTNTFSVTMSQRLITAAITFGERTMTTATVGADAGQALHPSCSGPKAPLDEHEGKEA
jgi:hypothetical protein